MKDSPRVNSVVCGMFHYRKYIGEYSQSGLLQAFYYSHKRSSDARTLGIRSGKAVNLWMKEYGLGVTYRLPSRWRAPDRFGPALHRLWENQVLRRWMPCDLLHVHVLGTARRIIERARAESTIVLGEPVMCHPDILNEILCEEHETLGLPPPPSVGPLFDRWRAELPLCDHLLVGSQVIGESYVRKGWAADRVKVIRYGGDFGRFYPLDAAEKKAVTDGVFRVICVAQITPRKGIHYLLEAWRRLAIPSGKGELLLIGSLAEAMRPTLERYHGTFTHLPHVSHEKLRMEYGRSSVFVLPSVEDGFGLVTAEAMGCGLPVIVTKAAGSADIVEDGGNGFVIPSRSVDAIQQALDRLYRDSDLRRSMAARSVELSVSRYRWSDFVAELVTYHRQLWDLRPGASIASASESSAPHGPR